MKGPTSWRSSPVAQAVAQTLEALRPGTRERTVARRVPAPSEAILVLSYHEDFDPIWELGDELLDWIVAPDAHEVVLILEGQAPESGVRGADSLSAQHWAMAATVAAWDRAPGRPWRLTVLDCVPDNPGHGRPPDASILRPLSLMPHLSCLHPWELNTLWQITATSSTPPFPASDEISGLRDAWNLIRAQVHDRRRSILAHELGAGKELACALRAAADVIAVKAVAARETRDELSRAWSRLREHFHPALPALVDPILQRLEPEVHELERWITEACDGCLDVAVTPGRGVSALRSIVTAINDPAAGAIQDEDARLLH